MSLNGRSQPAASHHTNGGFSISQQTLTPAAITLSVLVNRAETMNWDAVGAIGEIVGATAVIATLVYLAIQIRDSARASRSAALTDATTAMQAFYLEIGSNQLASQLFLRGLNDPDSLSRDDEFQYLFLMHSSFLGFQHSFFLAQEGTLDVGLRDSTGTAVQAVGDLPGMHLYWRRRKAFFQPEFRTWVEGLLTQQSNPELQNYREFLSDASIANRKESD